jgi:hypothetical protein
MEPMRHNWVTTNKPTESSHSHLITLPPHLRAASRLAAEESFSWHHHFGPSPAFLPCLRPPMDDPTFFINPLSLSHTLRKIAARDAI